MGFSAMSRHSMRDLAVDTSAATATTPTAAVVPDSQHKLDTFVATQLIDNGMDAIAKKINRLHAKLHHATTTTQVSGGTGDGDGGNDLLRRRYARQLQHWLVLACRLLARQSEQITDCIDHIDRDLKQGQLAGAATPTPTPTPTPSATPVVSTGQRVMATPMDSPFHESVLSMGRYVAAKVARSHELWILARVVRYSELTRAYEVEDVDAGEEEDEPVFSTSSSSSSAHASARAAASASHSRRRHYIVPRDHVKALPADTLPQGVWLHYALNQRVMAMYPNTTSFYRAVVRIPNPKGAPYVPVRFDDDADEFGSHAPDRKIPFRFIIPL